MPRRRARAAASGTTTASTTTPTTISRRRRCTATSPRWRRPASTSAITRSPTPGLKPRLPPPSALRRKQLRVCHVQYH
eukprot:scaffold38040_cov61-Phaeocystis_antarctica.AAC.2